MTTAFFYDEQSFWHSGGNYSFMAPVGGNVQPAATGGLPENPETKRRLVNLMNVTRLMDDLTVVRAAPASQIDLIRVHTGDFLTTFKKTSDNGGGETGLRAPYGPGRRGGATSPPSSPRCCEPRPPPRVALRWRSRPPPAPTR